MSRIKVLALALVLVATSHAASISDARNAISAAQSAWDANGPISYEFTVRFHEFILPYCEEQSFRVTRSHVHVLTSVNCHPAKDPVAVGTIPRLLRYARHLAQQSWLSSDFRFDSKTGVPYDFDVWDESVQDDFSGFEVTRFVPISP